MYKIRQQPSDRNVSEVEEVLLRQQCKEKRSGKRTNKGTEMGNGSAWSGNCMKCRIPEAENVKHLFLESRLELQMPKNF